MSFVHLSGLPSPGADSTRVSAGRRGDVRPLKAQSGGAAQRVRQKATRERRRSEGGSKRTIERTCVGCGSTGSAEELLRVVLSPLPPESEAGEVLTPILIDLVGKLPGRGAWIHPQPTCIKRACVRGFARAFGQAVEVTPEAVVAQLRGAAERRLAGLLLAAARSRQLVYGRDAVKEVLDKSPLVIMAKDAQAVAKDGDLQRAGLAGKVVWWSDKAQLGHWLGRSEVGVVAITEPSIADVMRRTIALSELSVAVRSGSGKADAGAEFSESAGFGQSAELGEGAEFGESVGLSGDSVGLGGDSAELDENAELGSSAERDEELSEVR